MKLSKDTGIWLTLTCTIVITVLLLLHFSGLSLLTNLKLQEYLTQSNTERQAGFVIVSLDDPLSNEAQALVADLSEQNNGRLFWVLPDEPISPQIQPILKQFSFNTIKIPSTRFSSDGQLDYVQQSQWQPTAGYLIQPELLNGVARTLPLLAHSNSDAFKSPLASLHPNHTELQLPKQFIDFSEVSLNSPIITSSLLQETDVIERLQQGKDVYFITDMELQHFALQVPLHPNHLGWHLLQFHAGALLAWESGDVSKELPLWLRLCLVLVFCAVLFILFFYSSPVTKQNRVFATGALLLLLCVPLCLVLKVIPPFAELLSGWVVMISSLHVLITRAKNLSLHHLEEQLKSVISNLSTHQDHDAFWQKIAGMVTQNLQLERCIFLEITDDANRLKEISAVNCSLQDIDEMRRDMRREPWLQAIQDKQAVRCSRSFFKNQQENETEILVPFYRSTQILGFWALTTMEQEPQKMTALFEQVNLFALQISTLLHLQQQTEQSRYAQRRLHQQLGNEQNQRLQAIQTGTGQLLTQLNFQRSLQNSTSSPLIVFDIFGRIAHRNDAMQRFAQRNNLDIETSSVLSFLKQILHLSDDSLKNLIRQITLQQKRQSVRQFVSIEGQRYITVISATNHGDNEQQQQELHLNLNGILVEIINLKDVQAYLQIERGLYDNYLIHIKNHLSTLQMGLLQIERKAQEPFINQLATYLNIELKKAADSTRRTHFFMDRLSVREDINTIPFNPLELLATHIQSKRKSAASNVFWRDVTFDVNVPSYVILGLGSPDAFTQLIKSGIKLMADDAIAPKHINIIAKHLKRDDTDVLYIKIESEGYGLPNQELQKLYQQNALLGEQNLLSDLLVALKTAKDANMDCRLKSRVGKGYRLSILIEGINLNE
ncbi:hypothetical protein [Planctobacterium marinum]|uniref:CHASE2 domain-containing protein n=1 Tax=Planctobacterium marinum TaxID=1631968 RepID=A0AA48HHS6_9ALTE|nr:hypothetical protein MACH26_04370 [Planctobacterium marinum]